MARSRLVAVLLAAALTTTGLGLLPGTPAVADARPVAVVAMGDSILSGESAGSYEPGTDRPGNVCHRSAVSEIAVTTVPGVDRRINLACSGAATENVALGGAPRYGEAPQAEQLRAVARDNRVILVALSVGANDVGFSTMVLDCIKAYFLLGPRCQDVWATRLPAQLAATAPRIAQNLADIRTVMREAGYADGAYQLVLQSYSSPVTEDMRYFFTRPFEGCPIRFDDARWARASAVPQFSATMGQVAAAAGARFLDLGPALRGREVCARGITHAQEWASGLVVDAAQIVNGAGANLVQQSFHPNALGHAQLGRCLTAFAALSATVPAARCVRGADGNLAPVALSTTGPATAATRVVPTVPEPAPIADAAEARWKEALQVSRR